MKKNIFIIGVTIFLSACSALGVGHYSHDYFVKRYVNENSKLLSVDGVTIHYRVEGNEQGETIVLLHGLLASLHTWDPWVEQLKKNYRIVRFDLPGFGLSGSPIEKDLYDRQTFMGFFTKVFERAGLKNFHIAGNSLGGYVAWNYALNFPDQVKTLTLIDSVAYAQEMPFLLKLSSNSLVNPFINLAVPSAFMKLGLSQVYGDVRRVDPAIRKRYIDFIMRKGNKASLAYMMQVFKKNSHDKGLSKGIDTIKHPTLLIWGSEDKWVPLSVMQRLKQDIKHAQSVVVPGAGHIPMEEFPKTTLKAYLNFLNNNKI